LWICCTLFDLSWTSRKPYSIDLICWGFVAYLSKSCGFAVELLYNLNKSTTYQTSGVWALHVRITKPAGRCDSTDCQLLTLATTNEERQHHWYNLLYKNYTPSSTKRHYYNWHVYSHSHNRFSNRLDNYKFYCKNATPSMTACNRLYLCKGWLVL
jgi:hypothetical protein